MLFRSHFDYIHMQLLNGAFDSLTHIYSQAFRCCKPGGWFEHVDVSVMVSSDDGSVEENSPLGQYGKLFKARSFNCSKLVLLSSSVRENAKCEAEKSMVTSNAAELCKIIGNQDFARSPSDSDPSISGIGTASFAR